MNLKGLKVDVNRLMVGQSYFDAQKQIKNNV